MQMDNLVYGNLLIPKYHIASAYCLETLYKVKLVIYPDYIEIISPVISTEQLTRDFERLYKLSFKSLTIDSIHQDFISKQLKLWNVDYGISISDDPSMIIVWYHFNEIGVDLIINGSHNPRSTTNIPTVIIGKMRIRNNLTLYRFAKAYQGLFSYSYSYEGFNMIEFILYTPNEYREFHKKYNEIETPQYVYCQETELDLIARKFYITHPTGMVVPNVNKGKYMLLDIIPFNLNDVNQVTKEQLADAIGLKIDNPEDIVNPISRETYNELSEDDLAFGSTIDNMFYRHSELSKLYYSPLNRQPISKQLNWDSTISPNNSLGMGLIPARYESINIPRIISIFLYMPGLSSIVSIKTKDVIITLVVEYWMVEHGILGKLFDMGILFDRYTYEYVKMYQQFNTFHTGTDLNRLKHSNLPTIEWYLNPNL
jgi:hypothetical protein